MTSHGDDRFPQPASDRCTIGELAEQMDMTVRNVRAYQARGLLPPPVVDGRVGYYAQAHRERLVMIRRLRSEGFNLVAISALLTGVVPVTTPTREPEPERTADPGAALLALGVPVDAVLALHREVAAVADQLATAYGQVYREHLQQLAGSATALPAIAVATVTGSLVPALQAALATVGQPARQLSLQEPAG